MGTSEKRKEFSFYLLLLFTTALMVTSHYGQTKSFVLEKEEEQERQEKDSRLWRMKCAILRLRAPRPLRAGKQRIF